MTRSTEMISWKTIAVMKMKAMVGAPSVYFCIPCQYSWKSASRLLGTKQ